MNVNDFYVSFGAVDALNPRAGYQIRIESDTGRTILFTSQDPSTGKPLTTAADCLRVAGYYIKEAA